MPGKLPTITSSGRVEGTPWLLLKMPGESVLLWKSFLLSLLLKTVSVKYEFVSSIQFEGVNQDLGTGCLAVAVVRCWTTFISMVTTIFQITTICTYLLLKKRYYIISMCNFIANISKYSNISLKGIFFLNSSQRYLVF